MKAGWAFSYTSLTPLMYACLTGMDRPGRVRALLAAGADARAATGCILQKQEKPHHGWGALHVAASWHALDIPSWEAEVVEAVTQQCAIIDLVAAAGADPTAPTALGYTALHGCALAGHYHEVQRVTLALLLRDHGASATAVDHVCGVFFCASPLTAVCA